MQSDNTLTKLILPAPVLASPMLDWKSRQSPGTLTPCQRGCGRRCGRKSINLKQHTIYTTLLTSPLPPPERKDITSASYPARSLSTGVRVVLIRRGVSVDVNHLDSHVGRLLLRLPAPSPQERTTRDQQTHETNVRLCTYGPVSASFYSCLWPWYLTLPV